MIQWIYNALLAAISNTNKIEQLQAEKTASTKIIDAANEKYTALQVLHVKTMDEKQDLLEETRALRTNLDTTNNKHTIEMKYMQEKLKAASLKNRTLELEKNQFSGITFGNGKVRRG